MKMMVDDVVYDTNKSKHFASISYRSTYYTYVDLYQTINGKFFEHCHSYHPEGVLNKKKVFYHLLWKKHRILLLILLIARYVCVVTRLPMIF